MAQTSINVRIDEKLKQEFEAVCNEIGLTMSAAFNVFAKTVCSRKEIPFKLAVGEEWGHLTLGNLLSPAETAGVAGEWSDDLAVPDKFKKPWEEAAVEKEVRKKRKSL